MNEIENYLKYIVHRSGLTKGEQTEWVAEMSTHLFDEVEHLKETGLEEGEAAQTALRRFGSRKEIRKQIARQTFGVTLPVINSFASIFFALFLLGIYLLYASIQSNPDPSTWASWHENPWVHFFTTKIPISPSLMLALCLDALMLVKTRCQRDRWALVLITGIFAALWLFMRISHHYYLAGLLIPGWNVQSAPLGVSDILLLCLSVATYFFTKNKSISRFPILLSLAIGLWVPIRDTVQYHLWLTTHWNGFWGHHDPNSWLGILLMVGIQLLLLVLLKYVFRAIDNYTPRTRSTA
ncbi:permease prefix domain 1-containing protein [Alicyclobacillus tolerans]|uniref:permease prefix domain 1-containing protein n=1 Tax=Alicyclobacillus tolerans TaxID=90970 RepID=UPI001F2594BB|nr:permease prefix domain 1-containing protein [Alicyclobacillus tolerans]MCF8564617.1 permease prefix domain 1-containing protein [Alicyclobacillus tolerans]